MTKDEVFSLETLEKGKRRYEKGKVKNIHMMDEMLYASVYGNDLYKVKINFDHDHHDCINKMSCSCIDAQLGRRCRHEAAVVVALENEFKKKLEFDLNDNHREDRVRWALSRMSEDEIKLIAYEYIKNDTKENRHMVLFKYAFKELSEKENYIYTKAKDIIDSYENYYALVDEGDERLFEIVPKYVSIETVFPFIEELAKEGYEKDAFKLLFKIFNYLITNSEATYNIFAGKLLDFIINLLKFVTDESIVDLTFDELEKTLNNAKNVDERNLIFKKIVYGIIDEKYNVRKLRNALTYLNLNKDNNLVEASRVLEVFLRDTLLDSDRESKEYHELVDTYNFLPVFLLVKVDELEAKGELKEAAKLINDAKILLEKDYNYKLVDKDALLRLADIYKKLDDKKNASRAIKEAFKYNPTKEILVMLKEVEDDKEYQKDLLTNYTDLKESDAIKLLLDEDYSELALKLIEHRLVGKYALNIISKNFEKFRNVDKDILKEAVMSKINEALEGTISIKYNDVLTFVKLVYRIDGNKEECIKILRLWEKRFSHEDRFVDLIEDEIKRLK